MRMARFVMIIVATWVPNSSAQNSALPVIMGRVKLSLCCNFRDFPDKVVMNPDFLHLLAGELLLISSGHIFIFSTMALFWRSMAFRVGLSGR